MFLQRTFTSEHFFDMWQNVKIIYFLNYCENFECCEHLESSLLEKIQGGKHPMRRCLAGALFLNMIISACYCSVLGASCFLGEDEENVADGAQKSCSLKYLGERTSFYQDFFRLLTPSGQKRNYVCLLKLLREC